MKKYTLRFREVDRHIFEQIRKKEKTVETRAATVKYKDIKKGDGLIFVCGGDKIEKEVKNATLFKSVRMLLRHHGIRNIMPDFSTIKEALKRYKLFPGYEEKIKKFGIIALELQDVQRQR